MSKIDAVGEWVAHYIAKPLLIFMVFVAGLGLPVLVVLVLWTVLIK